MFYLSEYADFSETDIGLKGRLSDIGQVIRFHRLGSITLIISTKIALKFHINRDRVFLLICSQIGITKISDNSS